MKKSILLYFTIIRASRKHPAVISHPGSEETAKHREVYEAAMTNPRGRKVRLASTRVNTPLVIDHVRWHTRRKLLDPSGLL